MRLINGDCLEVLKQIPDGSIDLVLTDPPYNIGKAKWDKIPHYIEWCGKWLKEVERVLKGNGSFYFWHNDMPQIAQLMEWIRQNTGFKFKQLITWNKRFDGSPNKGFMDGFVEVGGLRNYQQMCEYCLFYANDTVLNWITEKRVNAGLTMNDVDLLLGKTRKKNPERGTELCRRWEEGSSVPNESDFVRLCDALGVQRDYREYLAAFEAARYAFNNQGTHHSVWNYETAPKQGHITPKPVAMLENILRHSSNPGDTVLDCFMGSGSTGVACVQTGRDFIGIELDANYFAIAQKRIEQAQAAGKQMALEA